MFPSPTLQSDAVKCKISMFLTNNGPELYALTLCIIFRKALVFLERLLWILANLNENYRRYNFQAFANISGNFRKIPGNLRTTVIICRLIVILTKLGQCVLFLFLLKFTLLDLFTIFITARGKASFASGVYAGRHIRLSVRLSDTLRYYVKTRRRRRMQPLPPGSRVPPIFWRQEWLMGDDPVQAKVECKEVDPCENSRAVHISPHNSGTVIDSENTGSSVNANRKSNMGFPTSHQSRSCVTPDFSRIVFRCPNLSFFAEISTKPYKYATKFHFVYKLPAINL